jgi:hypothetical protein
MAINTDKLKFADTVLRQRLIRVLRYRRSLQWRGRLQHEFSDQTLHDVGPSHCDSRENSCRPLRKSPTLLDAGKSLGELTRMP